MSWSADGSWTTLSIWMKNWMLAAGVEVLEVEVLP